MFENLRKLKFADAYIRTEYYYLLIQYVCRTCVPVTLVYIPAGAGYLLKPLGIKWWFSTSLLSVRCVGWCTELLYNLCIGTVPTFKKSVRNCNIPSVMIGITFFYAFRLVVQIPSFSYRIRSTSTAISFLFFIKDYLVHVPPATQETFCTGLTPTLKSENLGTHSVNIAKHQAYARDAPRDRPGGSCRCNCRPCWCSPRARRRHLGQASPSAEINK